MCMSLHVFLCFFFVLFATIQSVYNCCLFSKRERKKAWSWMSGEDLGDKGRRETSLRYTVYEKPVFNKK